MNIEDMLTFVILAGITVGMLYFLSGKFIELKVFKEELIQSRDTIDMLQFLLTSSDLLVSENGRKVRLALNKTLLEDKEKVEKILNERSFTDYNYRLEIFSNANFSEKIFDLDFTYFNLNSECYQQYEIYYPISRDSSALLCEKPSNYFCEPVIVRLTTVKTPLSQLATWISKLCSGYPNVTFEKHIILDTSELINCTGGKKNCGIKYSQNYVCFYLENLGENKPICKQYNCELPIDHFPLSPEKKCTDIVLNKTIFKVDDKTFEKIIINAPHITKVS
jgi:hypothetical protein